MPRPQITQWAGQLFKRQLNAVLDWLEAAGGGGGGPIDIADVTGLQDALNDKQDTLASGVDIKTINGNSLLGSGDIAISGGSPAIAWVI